MTKDTVDPGLLELDDEALIEEWVISTELGIRSPGGSGVDGNPNGAVVARGRCPGRGWTARAGPEGPCPAGSLFRWE